MIQGKGFVRSGPNLIGASIEAMEKGVRVSWYGYNFMKDMQHICKTNDGLYTGGCATVKTRC